MFNVSFLCPQQDDHMLPLSEATRHIFLSSNAEFITDLFFFLTLTALHAGARCCASEECDV